MWLAVLAAEKGSIRKVNAAAGATDGMAIRWLYGDGKPGTGFRVKIQEAFGVPILAWDQPTTEAFVPPALRETEPDAPELAHGDLPARVP